MQNSDIPSLMEAIREFARARGWEQFHNPKNLAMAISGEAGELVAEFQWLTMEQSELDSLTPEQLEAIRFEIADVFIYLLRLTDVLEIDLDLAVRDKLKINESRFGKAE